MLADPVIAPLAEAGRLKAHAWFNKSTNPQLEVFDPAQESFILPYTSLCDSSILKFIPGKSHDGSGED